MVFNLIKKCLWGSVCFSSAVLFSVASAQSVDSRGTEFWLGFPDNGDSAQAELSIFVSSEQDATINIEIPSQSFVDSFEIAAGVAEKYVFPEGLETEAFDEIIDLGIKVTSDEEVSIYGLSRFHESTDAFLALPNDVIGQAYLVLAHDSGVLGQSEYLVVATEDNTLVSIVNSPLDSSVQNSEITLNEGQVYAHRAQLPGEDVSGTQITSSAPIAVLAGHQCANIPDVNTLYCDHVLEQLNPVSTWGTRFFTTPLATRLNGDTFKILASEDETSITINGEQVSTINRGEYFETILTDASFIVSSGPTLLAQYSNGTTFDNVTSDPFMMLVPPFEQFLDRYTFSVPTEGFRVNYANIVVRSDSISSLLLDGEMIPPNSFSQIYTTDYSFAQIELEPGSHTLQGAVSGVYSYGYDDFDSYGYSGGLSLSNVGLVASVNLNDEFELLEDQACFSALVSDIDNLPLESIRVDFIVDLIEGSDRTNEDGIATFCVSAGDNPSEFEVTATVGGETVVETVSVPEEEGGSGGGAFSTKGLLILLLSLSLARRRSFLSGVR